VEEDRSQSSKHTAKDTGNSKTGEETIGGVNHEEELSRKKTDRIWMTDGTPPVVDHQAGILVTKLASIDSSAGLTGLHNLITRLSKEPVTPSILDTNLMHPHFHSLVNSCMSYEADEIVNDFLHMMCLFEIACYMTG
jgi:hypothetical protein